MIQNIIAISIVFIAVFYSLYSFVKTLRTKDRRACSGCASCGPKEVHKPEIKAFHKKNKWTFLHSGQ